MSAYSPKSGHWSAPSGAASLILEYAGSRETSNKIIQKGLASARRQSGTVSSSERWLRYGRDWQSARFDDSAFLVSKTGQTQHIPFTSLRARTLRNGWLFSSIRIELENANPILLKGIGRSNIAFGQLASRIDEAATNHLKRNTKKLLAITTADCGGLAFAMPTHDRLRSDDRYGVKDARKSAIEPNEQSAISPG
jgi:hypothetical protein